MYFWCALSLALFMLGLRLSLRKQPNRWTHHYAPSPESEQPMFPAGYSAVKEAESFLEEVQRERR